MATEEKCKTCGAKCCLFISFYIGNPVTRDDYENVKWCIYHKGITVFIDKAGEWAARVPTRCMHLDSDNKCRIYDKRPPLCRQFSTVDCEALLNPQKEFRTAEEVDAYIKELEGKGEI